MWNEPSEAELRYLPGLYATDRGPIEEKVFLMHFFLAGCDGYMAEYNPLRRTFFGYAILNNDLENAEWGSISFDELRELKTPHGFEVDRDVHWKACKVAENERVVAAEQRQGRWRRQS